MLASALPTDVAGRMDRLPLQLLHVLATGICTAALVFDLLEISLSSALSAWFTSAPHVAHPAQLGWLMSSVFIGAIVGAPFFGWIADRYGRRVAMTATLFLLAAASLGAAGSSGIADLIVWRGIAGLALGAFPPLMMSYLADILPPNRRGSLIFISLALAALGPVGGIFLIRWLLPLHLLGLDAWRWGFIAGGSGAGMAALLFLAIPESPRWLQANGRLLEAALTCDRFERSVTLLAQPALPTAATLVRASPYTSLQPTGARRWSLVALLFFLSPWATVAFPILTGAVLSRKGFQLNDNLFYIGLSSIGPVIGTLLAALIVDRIGRRVALTLSACAMAGSGIWFSISMEPTVVACTIVCFTIFAFLYISILNVYGAEQFPTSMRATLMASAWSCNRVGAAIAPMVLLPLLHSTGPTAMFSVIVISLVASVAVLTVAPSGKQRQGLT